MCSYRQTDTFNFKNTQAKTKAKNQPKKHC